MAESEPIGVTTTPEVKMDLNTTPGTYSFGQNTINLPYYIHNLGTNVQSYMSSKNWGDLERLAFQEAYNNYIAGLQDMSSNKTTRLRTDDFGTIYDTAGVINEDNHNYYVVPGGSMVEDINELRKKDRKLAIPFNAYRELASYANTIGLAIVAKNTPNSTSSADTNNLFDIGKHGVLSYWINKLDPAGYGLSDITPFLNLDPIDLTSNTRGKANRMAYLANILEEYKALLPEYDYSKSTFKTGDIYKQRLDEAIAGLKDGQFTDLDKLALMQIGLDPKITNDFFTDLANLQVTSEQNVEALAQDKFLKEAKALYDANRPRFNEDSSIDLNRLNIQNRSFDLINDILYHNYGFKFPDLKTPEKNPEQVKNIYQQFAGSVLTALRSGQDLVNINGLNRYMTQALPLVLEMIQNEFQPVEGQPNLYYLDRPEDEVFGSVLVWDKARNKVYYTWAFNIPNSSAYDVLKNNYLKLTNVANSNGLLAFKKEGGVILKFDNGGGLFENIDFGAYGASTMEHAALRGISPEELRLKDRQIGANAETTALNPESTNWTASDYERLTGIGLDLASMFMTPGAGLVTSVGGTAAHAIADFTDPSVSGWLALKNLGMSLGLDALAIVPGMESVKIAHGLKPFVPKLMKWVSTGMAAAGGMATIKNGNEILNSLQKLADNDPNTKMTVGDWQNIAQAVMGVTGVYNVGRGHYAYKLAKNAVTVKGLIGLGLVDNNGGTRNVIFKGNKADQVSQILGNKSLTYDLKRDQLNTLIKDLGKIQDSTGAEIDYSLYKIGELDTQSNIGSAFSKSRNFFKRKKGTDTTQETTGKNFDIFNVVDSSRMPQSGYWTDVSRIYKFDDSRTRSAKQVIEYGAKDLNSFDDKAFAKLLEDNPDLKALIDKAKASGTTEHRQAVMDKITSMMQAQEAKILALTQQGKTLSNNRLKTKDLEFTQGKLLKALLDELQQLIDLYTQTGGADSTIVEYILKKDALNRAHEALSSAKSQQAKDIAQENISRLEAEIAALETTASGVQGKVNNAITKFDSRIEELKQNNLKGLSISERAEVTNLEKALLDTAIARANYDVAKAADKKKLLSNVNTARNNVDILGKKLNIPEEKLIELEELAYKKYKAEKLNIIATAKNKGVIYQDKNGSITNSEGKLYGSLNAAGEGAIAITAASRNFNTVLLAEANRLKSLGNNLQHSIIDNSHLKDSILKHIDKLQSLKKTLQQRSDNLSDILAKYADNNSKILDLQKSQDNLSNKVLPTLGKDTMTALRDLASQRKTAKLNVRKAKAQLEALQQVTDVTNPNYIWLLDQRNLRNKIQNTPYGYDVTNSTGQVIKHVNLTWEDIVNKYKLLGLGGTITKSKLLAKGGVLFALKGTTVRHTTKGKGYSWNNNMGSTEEFADLLNSFNETNYQLFNDMQDSWYKNWTESNFKNNRSAGAQYQQGVYDRQGLYNTFHGAHLNNAIERAIAGFDEHYDKGVHDSDRLSSKHIGRRGTTGDNANKGYQDGYFSYMENLRHFGADLGNNDGGAVSLALIDRFNGILNPKNLRYYKGDNGMYYLGILNLNTSAPTTPNLTPTTPESTTSESTTPTIGVINHGTNTLSGPVGIVKASPAISTNKANDSTEPNKKGIMDQLGKGASSILQSPIASELLRNAWLNAENRKIGTFHEHPFYEDPLNLHRVVRGRIDITLDGLKDQATLLRLARNANTSSADRNTASLLDAFTKGLDMVDAKKKIDNDTIFETALAALTQEFANAKDNHDKAMLNRLEGIGILKNNAIREKELEHDILNNNNSLWSWINQLNYNKSVEKEAVLKAYNRARTIQDVSLHPEKYGINVSDAYRRVFINKELTTSELMDEDPAGYRLLVKDLENIEAVQKNQAYAINGANVSPYDFQFSKSNPESYSPTLTDPNKAVGVKKNGGTVTKAKIQEKIKNADRYLRRIEMENKYRDRHKERTHKSMYVSPQKKRS